MHHVRFQPRRSTRCTANTSLSGAAIRLHLDMGDCRDQSRWLRVLSGHVRLRSPRWLGRLTYRYLASCSATGTSSSGTSLPSPPPARCVPPPHIRSPTRFERRKRRRTATSERKVTLRSIVHSVGAVRTGNSKKLLVVRASNQAWLVDITKRCASGVGREQGSSWKMWRLNRYASGYTRVLRRITRHYRRALHTGWTVHRCGHVERQSSRV